MKSKFFYSIIIKESSANTQMIIFFDFALIASIVALIMSFMQISWAIITLFVIFCALSRYYLLGIKLGESEAQE